MLGEIYQRVTGTALFVAVDRLLAQPLGFRDWDPLRHARLRYTSDPLGATPRFPNYAMQLSARDLACLGQLYLNCGRWNGQQVVPASWIEQSTRCLVQTGLPKPFGHYGYLWWTIDDGDQSTLPGGSYSAIGLGGKAISIVPAYQLVIVALCAHPTGAGKQVAIPDEIVDAVCAGVA